MKVKIKLSSFGIFGLFLVSLFFLSCEPQKDGIGIETTHDDATVEKRNRESYSKKAVPKPCPTSMAYPTFYIDSIVPQKSEVTTVEFLDGRETKSFVELPDFRRTGKWWEYIFPDTLKIGYSYKITVRHKGKVLMSNTLSDIIIDKDKVYGGAVICRLQSYKVNGEIIDHEVSGVFKMSKNR